MINYIIEFLLQDKQYVKYVGYTADSQEWKNYKVVIVPSEFFDFHKSGTPLMPHIPLEKLEDTPILFGAPSISRTKDLVVIKADLVASAFFLLSRYEEFINKNRDQHGRFTASESILTKAEILQRPLVEEYGAILREALRSVGVNIPEPKTEMSVVLTHDVDVPFVHRNFISILGGIKRGEFKDLFKNIFCSLNKNTFYTFPWLLEQDAKIEDARKIYFLRNPLFPEYYDRPYIRIEDSDMRKLVKELKRNDVELGMHVSYASAEHLELVQQEKKSIEMAIGRKITTNRNHYLRLRSNEQLDTLIQAGIEEDFTIGFAEMPGFRMGTCRPVRYINPETLQVQDLVLHPLTIMDGSFSQYSKMDYTQAYETACKLINQVKKHGGELVMLWHNSEVRHGNYHKKLYKNLISYIENEKN
jgi:hypothetical protein